MRAVDTNVLLRDLVQDDEPQRAVAGHFIEDGAWVSHVVLVEAAWVLRMIYRRTPPEIAAMIEMLLGHGQFVLQDPDVVRAALDLYRRRPSLGFSDCMVLEIAKKAGHLPLGTFDKALGRIEGAEFL